MQDISEKCTRPILKLNFDQPVTLISHFIISYGSQNLYVLSDNSLKGFSKLKEELEQFF